VTRELAAFLLAFAGSATIGAVCSGCGSDSQCLVTPDPPAAQPPLGVKSLETFGVGADGHLETTLKDPENSTVEVKGGSIVIRYDTQGVHHEVVYDIVGPGMAPPTA
jgi:hypothetical protein